MFDFIYQFFGLILRGLYNLTNSYAGALLLFTLVVKVLMLPLAIKQQKNTLTQVKLRPKEALIRKRYAHDQKLLQEKLSEFYQKEGYNPMGGWLPMLIQFPIIIILYKVIQNPLRYIGGKTVDEIVALAAELGVNYEAGKTYSDIDVATASGLINFDLFGFIDLSQYPSLKEMSWVLLIPLFAALTAFAQTFVSRMSTKYTTSPEQANNPSMKLMTFSGPIISLMISFSLPAGIGFYWVINNVIGTLQTFLLNTFMSPKKVIEQAEAELKAQVEARRAKKAQLSAERAENIERKELERKNAARKAAGLKPLASLDSKEVVASDEEEAVENTKEEVADND